MIQQFLSNWFCEWGHPIGPARRGRLPEPVDQTKAM